MAEKIELAVVVILVAIVVFTIVVTIGPDVVRSLPGALR